MFDPNRHFLVITKRGADRLRHVLNQPVAEEKDLRNLLVSFLSGAEVKDSVRTNKGKVKTYAGEVTANSAKVPISVDVCFGKDSKGKDKMSPDKKMQVAFVVDARARYTNCLTLA